MKNVFVLLSCLFLLPICSYSGDTTHSGVEYYKVINVRSDDVLNIRRSYRHRSRKVGKIPPNAKCVAYLNRSHWNNAGQKWVKIRYNGMTGWVNSRYLQKTQQCGHSLVTKYYDVVQVAHDDVLNIRQSYHYRSRKVGEIPPNGKCVAYLNKSHQNWVKINYNGTIGWVNSRFLRPNAVCDSSLLSRQLSIPDSTPSKSDTTLDGLVRKAANRYHIDVSLACAIIEQESDWNQNAVSPKGAIGLMQIMPNTGKEACGLTKDELYEPSKNIDCGVYYFSEQLKQFGSEKLALCAYNAGPHRIINGKCPRFRETKRYVRKILANWKGGGQICPANLSVTSTVQSNQPSRANISAKGIADYRFIKGHYQSPKIWWKLVCQAIDVVYDKEMSKLFPDAVDQPAITPYQRKIWLNILDATVDDIYTDEVRLKGRKKAMPKHKIESQIKNACPIDRN